MYSQHNEEEIISGFFNGKVGKFLDIGAYDGITFSNTYKLVELGWEGTCVEPSSIVFTKLFNLMKNNHKIKLINSAISLKSEITKFYESNGDAIGTIEKGHKDKWESQNSSVKFRDVYIKTITIDELLAISGYDFSFLNLDVEGMNFDLVKQIPLNKLHELKLVCIEHDEKTEEIIKYFGNGWIKLLKNPENIILGRK